MAPRRQIALRPVAFLAFLAVWGLSAQALQAGPDQTDFVRAEGNTLIRNGETLRLASVSFANDYDRSLTEDDFDPRTSDHHTRADFARVRDLGFNSIRFGFNANWALEDSAVFWDWLDQNIRWARKADVLLTLDMHVPIGGFWLEPNAPEADYSLWTDPEIRQKTIDLWREIATRYRDEPIIAGYELLNEAVTEDDSGAQWEELAKDLVDTIREVDPNHLLIVGALYGTDKAYAGMDTSSFVLIDDPNVMYDFHFYEPIEFTHQNASWVDRPMPSGSRYPDHETPIPTGAQRYLDDTTISTESIAPDTTGWTSYESEWVRLEHDEAIAGLPVAIMRSGTSGTARFDAIEVYEYDMERQVTERIIDEPLSDVGIWQWWDWASGDLDSETYTFARSTSGGANDDFSLETSGLTEDDSYLGWSSDSHWFRATPGNLYQIKGRMSGDEISYDGEDGFVGFEIAFYGEPDAEGDRAFLYRDREFLEAAFQSLYQFGVEHDVPMSVLEFGVMRDAFEDGRPDGAAWIADMLDIFEDYDTSFSLWNYHGASMGIFQGTDQAPPAAPNQPLIDILREKLRPAD